MTKLCAVVAVFLGLAAPAWAATVTINNFSFETPVLGFGNFTVNTIPNWTVVTDPVGVYNPNTFSVSVPDGSNTAYANPGGEFFQDVGPLVANSTYTFGVFVGERNDIGLPTYTIQLLDATTSTVFASGIPSPPAAGHFVLSNLTFDSAGFASNVGDNIRIEFSAAASNNPLTQVNFDDVTLGYSADSTTGPAPVPEPASLTLIALGLAGGLTRHRRRRLSRSSL
jgi:hypothetical protein